MGSSGIHKKNNFTLLFIIFTLPALVLYSLFFIYPFIQGINYSFLEWNGIDPEIPQQMDPEKFETLVDHNIPLYFSIDEYEKHIINKISDVNDKMFFNKFYSLNSAKIEYVLNIQKMKNDDEFTFSSVRLKLNEILVSIHYRQQLSSREIGRIRDSYEVYSNVYRLKNETSIMKRNAIKRLLKKAGYENIRNVGLSNFKKMFHDVRFKEVISFTLFFTCCNVLIINILGLGLALILDAGIRHTNLLRGMFFLPNVLSLIIVAYIWSFIFREGFPALYQLTGWELFSVNWIADLKKAPWAIVLTSIWQGVGYIMIIYLAGLQTIPSEILEVASIDGAGPLRKFTGIIIPLLLPSITISFFITLTNSLKTFEIMLALTDGMNNTTSFVLNVYYEAFRRERVGYSTAQAIILLFVIMFISTIQLSIMKRKETEM